MVPESEEYFIIAGLGRNLQNLCFNLGTGIYLVVKLAILSVFVCVALTLILRLVV